jgi:hypothetical protein
VSRFIAGLIGGVVSGGITYAVTGGSSVWPVSIALIVACVIWFGVFLDELLP